MGRHERTRAPPMGNENTNQNLTPPRSAATRRTPPAANVSVRRCPLHSRTGRRCNWLLTSGERARKARLICSGAASRLNCPMGVQLGFMGVQLGGEVIWAGSQGCGCGAGTSGQQREAVTGLPDDGAPRCGCRRPVLACSSIPADRGYRFRRSGARTGHVARATPRYSPAECRPLRSLSC
jgi:hypothetical protein